MADQLSLDEKSDERTNNLFGMGRTERPKKAEDSEPSDGQEKAKSAPRPGHGRNGVDAFTGAEKVASKLPDFKPGGACPECLKGRLYEQKEKILIRIVGHAPLHGNIHSLQSCWCNLCGETFTAAPPEGVGDEKYDASAKSMVAVLKYGSGMPFNRIEGLQASLGVPLPASTQWDLMEDAAEERIPVA